MELVELEQILYDIKKFNEILGVIAKERIKMSQVIMKVIKETIQKINESDQELIENIDPFYNKAFIQSGISQIECEIYVYKELILRKIKTDINPKYSIEWSDLAVLYEKTASVKNDGKIKLHDNFPKFTHSFRFTLEMLEKVFDISLIDFSSDKWEKFQTLIQKRNKITHPKSIDDFHIAFEEFENLMLVLDWFSDISNSFVMSDNYSRWFEQIEDLIDKKLS